MPGNSDGCLFGTLVAVTLTITIANNGGSGFMNALIRVVKRGSQGSNDLQPGPDEKTSREVQREMVSTVKGWIAERTQRKREEELIYLAFRK
jgi:hypothetical protein